MTSDRDGTDHDGSDQVMQTVWTTAEEGDDALDEDCSPTRVCRNAREFSFDGIAEDGVDLQTAWRETLAREGKLESSAESIRDLVFGQTTSN